MRIPSTLIRGPKKQVGRLCMIHSHNHDYTDHTNYHVIPQLCYDHNTYDMGVDNLFQLGGGGGLRLLVK